MKLNLLQLLLLYRVGIHGIIKKSGLNIWNIFQIILNNILLYSLLRALAVQRRRCCLCMWVTQSDNLRALWTESCSAPERLTRRKKTGKAASGSAHSISRLPVHYEKQLAWQMRGKCSENHKAYL